jgi:hypothetical protein
MANSVKKPGDATTTTKPRKSPVKQKSATAQIVEMPLNHEQIALLAHRYWVESGCQEGHDADYWLRAEQDLRALAS